MARRGSALQFRLDKEPGLQVSLWSHAPGRSCPLCQGNAAGMVESPKPAMSEERTMQDVRGEVGALRERLRDLLVRL